MPSRPEINFLYLHGFASGPDSTKAHYFSQRLKELGYSMLVPDLNGGDFFNMTLTSQLQIIEDVAGNLPDEHPLVIIGSSLGGLLGTLYAQKCKQVKALILLAPGFGLKRRFTEMLGAEGLDQWKRAGSAEVFHHALNTNTNLSYGFLLDARTYRTDEITVQIPTLVFHGQNDTTVPVIESLNFHALNKGICELEVLEDDHQLLFALDRIWQRTCSFLKAHQLSPQTSSNALIPC